MLAALLMLYGREVIMFEYFSICLQSYKKLFIHRVCFAIKVGNAESGHEDVLNAIILGKLNNIRW